MLMAIGLVVAACGTDDPATGPGDAPDIVADDGADADDDSDAAWEAIVETAKAEGKVTFYDIHIQAQADRLKEAFERAYPEIELDLVRFTGGEEAHPAIEIERSTGSDGADVYSGTDLAWIREKAEEGWLVEAAGPNFDNPDYDRERWMPEGTYFLVSSNITGFAWNTERYTGPPLTTFEDFLNPELANGAIGIPDALGPALVDFYVWLEELMGRDYIEQLAAQEPRIYAPGGPIRNGLIVGETAAILFTSPIILDDKAAGAPVDFAPGAPEAWAAPFYATAFEHAKNPNAAQVLLNFMMSPEGQEAYAHYGTAVLPNISGSLGDIDALHFIQTDRLTSEFVSTEIERWNETFRR